MVVVYGVVVHEVTPEMFAAYLHLPTLLHSDFMYLNVKADKKPHCLCKSFKNCGSTTCVLGYDVCFDIYQPEPFVTQDKK